MTHMSSEIYESGDKKSLAEPSGILVCVCVCVCVSVCVCACVRVCECVLPFIVRGRKAPGTCLFSEICIYCYWESLLGSVYAVSGSVVGVVIKTCIKSSAIP